jgi:beta-glucanase (GH16 family)
MSYQLVWHESFQTGNAPDPAVWSFETGYVRNKERQYYTSCRPENCRIDNNQLILEARKEAYCDYAYTSASITTKGKKSFLYGKLVVRAKLPQGRGIWPAIWTLGTNIDEVNWPLCGEIDIMEHVGYEPLNVHGNIHTATFNHNLETNQGDFTESDTLHNEFHDFAIDWRKDQIDFQLDDVTYFTFSRQPGFTEKEWPFDKPHYLLINLAVGGFWGGKKGIDDTIFPQRLVIDSIKYFQFKSSNIITD